MFEETPVEQVPMEFTAPPEPEMGSVDEQGRREDERRKTVESLGRKCFS